MFGDNTKLWSAISKVEDYQDLHHDLNSLKQEALLSQRGGRAMLRVCIASIH